MFSRIGIWRSLLILCVLWSVMSTVALAVSISYTGWGTTDQIKSVEAEIAAFKAKYPDANIDIQNQFAPWDGYHEKLIVQAAAKALPDVMLIQSAQFANIEAYDVFLDLRPYFERDRLRYDYLPPGAKDFLTLNGKLAAMPAAGFAPGSAMVHINKDLFDKAGIKVPSYDWTWNDLLNIAKRLTIDTNGDGTNEQFGVDFGSSMFEGVWEYILRAYGGSIWNQDFSASVMNSPAAEQAFTFLRDFNSRWGVSGGDFMSGNVGISIQWAGEVSRRMDVAPFTVVPLPMPKGPAGRGIPPVTGRVHVFAISKYTKHPDEAWKFVKFLTTENEATLARSLISVASPSYKPVMEVYARRFPENKQEWLKVSLVHMDDMPPAQSLGSTVLISYNDRQSILTYYLSRFYNGDIPVTEALNGIKRDMDVRLKEVRDKQAAAAKK